MDKMTLLRLRQARALATELRVTLEELQGDETNITMKKYFGMCAFEVSNTEAWLDAQNIPGSCKITYEQHD